MQQERKLPDQLSLVKRVDFSANHLNYNNKQENKGVF